MDDLTDFAATRFMMAHIFYALGFLLTLVIQTGVVASLPSPYNVFPFTLVVGVIFLHERSIVLGALWMVLSGLVLEARGLGSGLAFASLVAAVTALVLALSIFAKRSFWALLAVGGGTALAYVLARLIWLLVLTLFFTRTFAWGQLFEQSLAIVLMMLSGVFIFGAYIRRFIRWSRDRFVRKEQIYDISFPH